MATRDEIILGLYNNVDVDALVAAKRTGNLLAYYSTLAERIVSLGPIVGREEQERIQEEVNRNSMPRRSLFQVETRSNTMSPPTPQPRSVMDRVQVRQV